MRTETLNLAFNRDQTPAVSHFTPELSVESTLPCGFKLREVKQHLVAKHLSGSTCLEAAHLYNWFLLGCAPALIVRGDQRLDEGRAGKKSREGRERKA